MIEKKSKIEVRDQASAAIDQAAKDIRAIKTRERFFKIFCLVVLMLIIAFAIWCIVKKEWLLVMINVYNIITMSINTYRAFKDC